MEFKHFAPFPASELSVKGITPNFPLGAGQIDFTSIKKNQAHFEEVAVQVGLGALKGAILKNTFKFFQPKQSTGIIDVMPEIGRSAFGFPIFSNLIIKGDTYQSNNGITIGSFNDIRLDVVIMEMDRENNLVTEDIQGRNGTVIEYISSKSVNIHITGRILANSPGIYPRTAVEELSRALYSNKSLRVNSWFLAMRGIYNIVVKKDSIKQEEGGQEFQVFEFDALSDMPVILRLKGTNIIASQDSNGIQTA